MSLGFCSEDRRGENLEENQEGAEGTEKHPLPQQDGADYRPWGAAEGIGTEGSS